MRNIRGCKKRRGVVVDVLYYEGLGCMSMAFFVGLESQDWYDIVAVDRLW
jgi:hypothetical protein